MRDEPSGRYEQALHDLQELGRRQDYGALARKSTRGAILTGVAGSGLISIALQSVSKASPVPTSVATSSAVLVIGGVVVFCKLAFVHMVDCRCLTSNIRHLEATLLKRHKETNDPIEQEAIKAVLDVCADQKVAMSGRSLRGWKEILGLTIRFLDHSGDSSSPAAAADDDS